MCNFCYFMASTTVRSSRIPDSFFPMSPCPALPSHRLPDLRLTPALGMPPKFDTYPPPSLLHFSLPVPHLLSFRTRLAQLEPQLPHPFVTLTMKPILLSLLL